MMARKRIVVLGGGESGYGSAYLAKKQGYEVFLSDKGKLKEKYRSLLEEAGIPFEEGKHTPELILSADEIIKSPGLPETAEIMRLVREKGVHVISEIEFAGRFTEAKCLCVTGSNGKTTVTSLIYEMLLEAGYNVGLGGNIGMSFAYQVATEKHDWYVLELSSFQLDDMYEFRAHISLLTNITPDHLDRYDYDLSKYAASKFRVTQNQDRSDYFVYNMDDPQTAFYLENHDMCHVTEVGVTAKSRTGNFLDQETEVFRFEDKGVDIDLSKRLCAGLHNAYNFIQASAAALLAGVPAETVRHCVDTFGGIEHRMEHAGTVNGVTYINDSKATNVDAAWYALESMKTPVVWIAGGTDKGNDYSQLYGVVGNVHTLVCMGLDNSKLERAFTGRIKNIVSSGSFAEAMAEVQKYAEKGDTVLLSPACASFDLFSNYEERGEMFKDFVKSIK